MFIFTGTGAIGFKIFLVQKEYYILLARGYCLRLSPAHARHGAEGGDHAAGAGHRTEPPGADNANAGRQGPDDADAGRQDDVLWFATK